MLRAQKGRAYARALEKFSEHLKLLEHKLDLNIFNLYTKSKFRLLGIYKD